MTDNPLLAPSPLPLEAPRFDLIREEHYLPAVQSAIEAARANITALKANAAAPDFENTIAALETASELLGFATGVFYNQISAAGTDGLEAIAEKIGPLTANFSSDVALDPDLFARVKAVYDRRGSLSLTPEQKTLLDETYKGFVRNGALLDEAGKARLRAIDEQLSVLGVRFDANLKKSMEAFTLTLRDEKDLVGLPRSAVAGAKDTAQEKGEKDAWVFTLDAPSYGPFLTYSSRRDLREKMWRAYNTRAFGDAFDNCATLLETVRLRDERAKLLGYTHHAAYVLEKRMAETPARVHDFLNRLTAVYRPAAQKDLKAIADLAQADGVTDIKPWDVAYYGEKLKQKLFAFSDEDLRPYFPLEKVLSGTFDHFSRLFGLRFQKNAALPVWHKDVVAYDVVDATDARVMGILYADFHPRTGKKPGAWMTNYREQGLWHGKVARPIVSIVCNFTKPTKDQPSLLTHDEVLTLFHEMGHAIHGLLSEGTYKSLSGTNVLWDFVELPSQVQENWTYAPETLALVSAHHETGARVPDDLIAKLNAARNFMAGWAGLRQNAFAQLDMAWHTGLQPTMEHVSTFEDSILNDILLFPRMAGPASTAFGHIFAGGYAAGYYSYKWAEVLDADTFELFQEKGLYDSGTAQKYRREILSKGGSEHPAILYRRFRGRDADPDALLRREGLLAA